MCFISSNYIENSSSHQNFTESETEKDFLKLTVCDRSWNRSQHIKDISKSSSIDDLQREEVKTTNDLDDKILQPKAKFISNSQKLYGYFNSTHFYIYLDLNLNYISLNYFSNVLFSSVYHIKKIWSLNIFFKLISRYKYSIRRFLILRCEFGKFQASIISLNKKYLLKIMKRKLLRNWSSFFLIRYETVIIIQS